MGYWKRSLAGGGNMTPEGYTNAYRRYASAMPQLSNDTARP